MSVLWRRYHHAPHRWTRPPRPHTPPIPAASSCQSLCRGITALTDGNPGPLGLWRRSTAQERDQLRNGRIHAVLDILIHRKQTIEHNTNQIKLNNN